MKNLFLILSVSLLSSVLLSAQDVAMVNYPTTEQNKKEATEKPAAFVPLTSTAPTFQGGHLAMTKFMEEHLQYPSMAQKMGKEGIVVVACKIDTDGSITEAKILQGLGFGFDEEVLRLVSTMPKWQAAQHGTRKVATTVKIPIAFKLQ